MTPPQGIIVEATIGCIVHKVFLRDGGRCLEVANRNFHH